MTSQDNGQPVHPMVSVDSYTPAEIARLVEEKGVTKAHASWMSTLALGVLAGAFIAFGAVLATTIGSQSTMGFGPTRLLMGVGFSLGLILVVVAGAELFTGNNLVVMSWVSRRITLKHLLRNWGIVYIGNLLGALVIVFLLYFGKWWAQDDNNLGVAALVTADSKVNLSFEAAFARGILANALVCLAIWMGTAGRTIIDKAVGIVFPITAFVAAGFEHSIANMYFLPIGLLLSEETEVLQAAGLGADQLSRLTLPWAINNIAAVTLGNIVGGSVFVGLTYWFIYLREEHRSKRNL